MKGAGSAMLAALALAGLGAASAVAVEEPAELTLTGQSYGIAVLSSGVLTPASIPGPDTGRVETTSAGTYDAPCAIDQAFALGKARALCAGVATTPGVDGAVATASAGEVRMTVPSLGEITLVGLKSQSTTQCSGSQGTSSVAEIRAAGQVMPIGTLAPNTAYEIAVPGEAAKVRVIFNEQIDSGDQLTVNAAHVIVTGGGAGSSEVVVASATSGIQNCVGDAEITAPGPVDPSDQPVTPQTAPVSSDDPSVEAPPAVDPSVEVPPPGQ